MKKNLKKVTAILLVLILLVLCAGCNTTDNQESTQAVEANVEDASPAAEMSEENTSDTAGQENQTKDTSAAAEESSQEETTQELPALKAGYEYAWITSYGTLNVRKKAKKKADCVGTVGYHERVIVKGKKKNGYYKITGKDADTGKKITGYCSAKYLTFEQPVIKQVQLDIPLYLQTDKKWAKATLGSSGRTIKAIGCTTTCLAMSETYIRGKNIYPDDMEKELYYTSRGELGWPSTYKASYDETTYLRLVYDKLAHNIPVLLGCQRRNGRPHWVLITGYVGDGKKFKEKDFIINDPLPYKRTTLKQYRDEYPVFMKVVYSNGKASNKKNSSKNSSKK